MQPRRTQSERTSETRQRLINAAIERLLTHGMAGATVVEICREAEVTTGALQHQFGSKTGLMTAVVSELFKPFTEIRTPLDPTSSLEERVAQLVDHYWGIYWDERYHAVLEILLAARHDPELMPLVASFREVQIDTLSHCLANDFPDVNMPADEKVATVHWCQDLLRGHVFQRMFEKSEALDSSVIAESKSLVLDKFREHKKRERVDD